MCYADKLIVMPEHATLAPPICRLAGEVLSIGRRVTQKGVVLTEVGEVVPVVLTEVGEVVPGVVLTEVGEVVLEGVCRQSDGALQLGAQVLSAVEHVEGHRRRPLLVTRVRHLPRYLRTTERRTQSESENTVRGTRSPRTRTDTYSLNLRTQSEAHAVQENGHIQSESENTV